MTASSFFAHRAEKLFINIANEEAVSSESAGLVTALEDLDLAVTEERETMNSVPGRYFRSLESALSKSCTRNHSGRISTWVS